MEINRNTRMLKKNNLDCRFAFAHTGSVFEVPKFDPILKSVFFIVKCREGSRNDNIRFDILTLENNFSRAIHLLRCIFKTCFNSISILTHAANDRSMLKHMRKA